MTNNNRTKYPNIISTLITTVNIQFQIKIAHQQLNRSHTIRKHTCLKGDLGHRVSMK